MEFQDYVDFANENPLCYLATVEGDQPRVRPLVMWFADKTGFYFESKSVKALCKQLNNNNKVQLAFYSAKSGGAGKVMRVTGKVEFLEDMAIRKKVFEERPQMKAQGIKSPEDPLLAVFRVYSGEAFFWTMADNMKEAEIERAKF